MDRHQAAFRVCFYVARIEPYVLCALGLFAHYLSGSDVKELRRHTVLELSASVGQSSVSGTQEALSSWLLEHGTARPE